MIQEQLLFANDIYCSFLELFLCPFILFPTFENNEEDKLEFFFQRGRKIKTDETIFNEIPYQHINSRTNKNLFMAETGNIQTSL